MVQMAKVNGVRWYGHVLRRDDGHVLRKALEFQVKGKSGSENDQRRCGCSKRKQVFKELKALNGKKKKKIQEFPGCK